MNFFILCAGLGKRIRKYSGQKPKCLIKYKNKELLGHWIDGINNKKNKILINKHYGTKYIDKYINKLNTNVKIYSVYEKELLGSLGTIKNNIDFIKKTKDFFVVYSDSFCKLNFNSIRNFHKKKESNLTLVLFKTLKPKESGIVILNKNNKINNFIEKPKKPKSNLASAGIYLINTKYFLSKLSEINSKKQLDLSKNFIEKYYKENFYGYKAENFLPFGNNLDYEENINIK